MIGCEDVLVVVRADDLTDIAGTDLFAADDDWDVYDRIPLAFKLFVKGDTFRGALQICFYRFVCRGGEIDDCVIHNLLCHCKSDTLYLVPLAAGEVRHNYRHGAMVDGNLGKFYE